MVSKKAKLVLTSLTVYTVGILALLSFGYWKWIPLAEWHPEGRFLFMYGFVSVGYLSAIYPARE